MNVYSDSSHSALKYLMNTEINIYNLLIMTGNFNIRDSLWDPSFPYHLSISNDLIIIADSFNLELSLLTNTILTRYSDTEGKSNLVINLMFLWSRSIELNNHSIHPNLCLLLDHTPLTVSIPIAEENIHSSRLSIPKYSEEEAAFVKEATTIIKNLNTSNLTDHDKLKDVVNLFVSKIKQAWVKNTMWTNVMKHSKKWWSEECSQSLHKYRMSRNLSRKWSGAPKEPSLISRFKRLPTRVKALGNSWTGSTNANYLLLKLPSTIISYALLLTVFGILSTLHSILLFIDKSPFFWVLFSRKEFKNVISNCNNSSTPGPDKLSWSHLKSILKHDECLINIVNIANTCINLGH